MSTKYYDDLRARNDELKRQLREISNNIDLMQTICVEECIGSNYEIVVADRELYLTNNINDLVDALKLQKRTITSAIKRFNGSYDPKGYYSTKFTTKEDAEKCLEWLMAKSLSEM